MKLSALFLLLATAAFPQVKLPPYTRNVLPNGLVLDQLIKRDVPMISLRAIVRGGAEADPSGKSGLGAITAELLRRGSTSPQQLARTAEQFSEQLDFIGASLNSRVDEQSILLNMEFMAKDSARALDLFADALLRPSFPESELAKVLAQRKDSLRALKDNPGQANAAYFRSFFFPAGHPYRNSPTGEESSLSSITRQDLMDHHSRLFCGSNMILIAAGDATDQFQTSLRKVLEMVPAGQAYSWVKTAPPLSYKSARLLLIDKPDATQTYFLIAQPGIHRIHPDRVPLDIINTLFGGRFTSMLNDELRVNTGLTYGASSRMQQDRLPGSILISTYTKTDTTIQAIDLALTILKRIREKGIDQEQLDSAKAYLKGTFPPGNLETADQLAATLGNIELHDLNRGEVDDLFSRIDAVTLEKANAVARQYLQESNLQFCLLGQASRIQDAVKKYAPAMRVVPITDPGFRAPDF
ncbi:MAG: insulinase family protein [Acidobacteriia bacterium]|nr:insulinase family protein [Terriglobia bacterium]